MRFKVKVDMTPVKSVMGNLGLEPDGAAQKWLTHTIMQRMVRYIPQQTGALAEKNVHMKSPHEIVYNSPYAHYQWRGELMVDRITGSAWSKPEHGPKVYTGKPLNQTRGKNPLAGPYWEQRLMAAEGDQIGKDLAEYITRRHGK